MKELPAVRTHATPETMFHALVSAWIKLWGGNPARRTVLVLLAHWALETGSGQSCWCWNLTNVRHVATDGRDWCVIPSCSEVLTGVDGVKREHRYTREANPEKCQFRAYSTLEEGTADYLLTLRKKFSLAWPDVGNGDPEAFSRHLAEQHFYTASEPLYTRLLMRLFHQFDATSPTS